MNLSRAKVVVHVAGGIATIRKLPRGMIVLIIDEDTGDEPYVIKEVKWEGRDIVLADHTKTGRFSVLNRTVRKFLANLSGGE